MRLYNLTVLNPPATQKHIVLTCKHVPLPVTGHRGCTLLPLWYHNGNQFDIASSSTLQVVRHCKQFEIASSSTLQAVRHCKQFDVASSSTMMAMIVMTHQNDDSDEDDKNGNDETDGNDDNDDSDKNDKDDTDGNDENDDSNTDDK